MQGLRQDHQVAKHKYYHCSQPKQPTERQQEPTYIEQPTVIGSLLGAVVPKA